MGPNQNIKNKIQSVDNEINNNKIKKLIMKIKQIRLQQSKQKRQSK